MRETLAVLASNTLARREGCGIKASPSPSFARRVAQAGLPARVLEQIEPLLDRLNEQNRLNS